MAWSLYSVAAVAGYGEQDFVDQTDRQLTAVDAVPGGREIVVSMRDLGALGRPGRGDLIVQADGTASTISGGECLRLALPGEELDRLRRALADDLAGLQPEIRTSEATDQPLTSVAVLAPDASTPLEVAVYGGGGPAGFGRAVDRLATLVESIRSRGEVDERAPILVTVIRDPTRDAGNSVVWPQAVPEPALGQASVAYVPVSGDAACALRRRLGAPNSNVGVRLADGSVATASWTAVLPSYED